MLFQKLIELSNLAILMRFNLCFFPGQFPNRINGRRRTGLDWLFIFPLILLIFMLITRPMFFIHLSMFSMIFINISIQFVTRIFFIYLLEMMITTVFNSIIFAIFPFQGYVLATTSLTIRRHLLLKWETFVAFSCWGVALSSWTVPVPFTFTFVAGLVFLPLWLLWFLLGLWRVVHLLLDRFLIYWDRFDVVQHPLHRPWWPKFQTILPPHLFPPSFLLIFLTSCVSLSQKDDIIEKPLTITHLQPQIIL